MPRNITTAQKESIMLDSAVLFADYGLATQREIGITKGGVEFNVSENVRDIEYDGRRGKTKGMQVVDEINAYLKCSTLELSNDNILATLGAASETGTIISNTACGLIASTRYLNNVTAFGYMNKTGAFKKITLKNAAAFNGGMTIKTTDKGEATIDLQFNANWNPEDMTETIYSIEDDTTGITEALRTLHIASVDSSEAGKTELFVYDSPRVGMGFYYKDAGDSAPSAPALNAVITGATLFISGTEITIDNNDYIEVYELDIDGKCKGYAVTKAVVA